MRWQAAVTSHGIRALHFPQSRGHCGIDLQHVFGFNTAGEAGQEGHLILQIPKYVPLSLSFHPSLLLSLPLPPSLLPFLLLALQIAREVEIARYVR
jgi:hypothetical protein